MGKKIIITAGPTNERIDAVMQITNMSTGALGSVVATTILSEPAFFDQVDKVYYLCPKLARRPDIDWGGKLQVVEVTDTESLLSTMTRLLTDPDEHIDAVVHSAAVGDYKGRHVFRAEDLAREIADRNEQDGTLNYDDLLSIITCPACVQDDGTKISSYEPNLMVLLDLTPKVIGEVKRLSPDTTLIGFKLLENVPEDELVRVASNLRKKTGADYIVANDLARIGNGSHPAMVIGPDQDGPVVRRCADKVEIAKAIAGIIFAGNAG